jgi:hypothetical protein
MYNNIPGDDEIEGYSVLIMAAVSEALLLRSARFLPIQVIIIKIRKNIFIAFNKLSCNSFFLEGPWGVESY